MRRFRVGAGARNGPKVVIKGNVYITDNSQTTTNYNSHNTPTFTTTSSCAGHIYPSHIPNNDIPVDHDQTSNLRTTPIDALAGQELGQGYHGEQSPLAAPTVHGDLPAGQDSIQSSRKFGRTSGHMKPSPPSKFPYFDVGVQTDPWTNKISAGSPSAILDEGGVSPISPTFTKGRSSSPTTKFTDPQVGVAEVGIQTGQTTSFTGR
jgi:hypothetical protein